jgi:hypothetical protein
MRREARGEQALDLLPDQQQSVSLRSAFSARGNVYLNRHSYQRITLLFAMFGGFAIFLCARFMINNNSGHLPWWSDAGALLGAIVAVVITSYAFKTRLLVRRSDDSDLVRLGSWIVLVVFVVFPLFVALPRRYGNGYEFPPRIQVIGDAMGAVLCVLIVVTVTRTTLGKWREMKAAPGLPAVGTDRNASQSQH